MDRRRFLYTTAAAASALTAGPALAQADNDSHARLDELFKALFQEDLRLSPESATQLGLDKGPNADLRGKLRDESVTGRAAVKASTAAQLARLKAFPRESLSPADRINYDVVVYTRESARRVQAFDFGGAAFGPSPYVVSQLTGVYQSVPDFLDTKHKITSTEDADAYLSRMAAFAVQLDDQTAQMRHDAGLGVIPPDFILTTTLAQMNDFAATPAAASTLVSSLVRRVQAKGIAGSWQAPAAKLYEGEVIPALRRQIALLEDLRPRAVHEAGVARLPDGEAYYAISLKAATTTDLTPAAVHQLGLEQVALLTARLDEALKAQGLTQGAVWERLRGMFADPRFLYPNTDAGKAKLIADLNLKVAAVQAKLPAWFGTLPKSKVQIRRVPPAIEAGASSNYQAGALDGSRAGAYYIVLRDTAEDPSFLLPTLTFHESIPGHHLQGSLQREGTLPLLRKVIWFDAYGEGWALYAEQLAGEMGMYDDDPWGHVGYLHDALLRAARLVMDSGLHSQGWSREQAVRYYVENQGDPESAAVSEVERYCAGPGQACSYMVGKLEWLRLRQLAKDRLGPRFDIRAFHDAALLPGPTPLKVLDRVIRAYAA